MSEQSSNPDAEQAYLAMHPDAVVDPNKAHSMALATDKFEKAVVVETKLADLHAAESKAPGDRGHQNALYHLDLASQSRVNANEVGSEVGAAYDNELVTNEKAKGLRSGKTLEQVQADKDALHDNPDHPEKF
jgi:hypothetical protein